MSRGETGHSSVVAAIDRYFGGRAQPRDGALILEHLETCDTCRDYYERHQVLAQLDPKGLDIQQRVARSLGMHDAARTRFSFATSLTGGLALAAAAVGVLVVLTPRSEPGFQARGAVTQSRGRVMAYRVASGQQPQQLEGHIRSGDELAFAYENPRARSHLMIFGVDDSNRVYWYHPAWTDPQTDPTAIRISPRAGVHELEEAVAHDVHGHELRLFALFSDRAWHVREIEAQLSRSRSREQPAHLEGSQLIATLQVDR